MNTVVNAIATLATILSLQYGLPRVHDFVKREALKKVQQGLPSLSEFTRQLTNRPIKRNRHGKQ